MAKPAVGNNLLFGLLAMQIGLVSHDELLGAFRVWVRDKSQELADLLEARGHLDHADRAAIDLLVVRHLGRHDGDAEKSLSSLSAARSLHRQLADLNDPEIDASISHVNPVSTVVDVERTTTLGGDAATSEWQRFRILRPHAQGGLGSVYVALDAELNREVALKQILEHHADDPQSRHRFLVEAEVTGGLEHPGIVPVYGLGAYDDGRPYYAMRLIRGDSLKQAIRQFHDDPALKRYAGLMSLELRKLLRRFVDVCNAIHYAHSRGVLHRDIKPSNIIVGKYGETLVVDWGLAKATGKSDPRGEERTLVPLASGGSSETLPGSTMGTPPYMSPEQAAGDLSRLGPPSDVYSLGATLYHILCGTAPFGGDDVAAVIQSVMRGDFPRPRRVNPSLDRALEAVCLKAMALKPDDRHASAKALAEDVERWMADEPVSAFDESNVRRLSRWARRNAALVTGAGAILSTAVIALTGATWLVTRQNTHLDKARGEAAVQKEKAEIGKSMATRAVEEMLDQVARQDLLNVPQAEGLRVKLAERAVAFYRELDRLHPNDPQTRFELARVEEQLASLYRMIGNYGRASQEYAVSVDILRGLIGVEPANPKYLEFLGNTENQIAEMIKMQAGGAEAEPHYREAVRLSAELCRVFPLVPRYRSLAARTHNDFADMLASAGRHLEAEPLARDAAAAAHAYRASLPAQADAKAYLSDWTILPMVLATHGAILSKLDRVQDAEVPLRQAIDELHGLLEVYPNSTDLQYLLADTLRERAGALGRDPMHLAEAIVALDEAIARLTSLVAHFPMAVVYAQDLVIFRAERGATCLAAGRLEAAREDLAHAEEQLARRVDREKNSLEPVQHLGKVKGHLARLAARRGQNDQARALIKEAIEIQQRALAIDSESRVDQELVKQHRAFQKELAGN